MQRFWNRFAIGTNALEWLFTVPNLQIEYDLADYDISAEKYNNQSILVGVRYNWNTWHQQPAYYVFNVLDVRGEWRFHFPKDKPIKLFNKWDWDITQKHPWLAYYLGTYGNWNQFSMKPGPDGYQGWQAGIGAVFGFERKLYEYKKNKSAVDLDLGLAAGVSFSSADRFRLAASQESYTVTGHRYMLLPMIAEIRATFKWRPVSVDYKYVKEDPQITRYRHALEDIRTNFAQTNKQAFDDATSDKDRKIYAQNDSLYRATFVLYLEQNEHDLMGQIEYVDVDKSYKKKLVNAIKQGTRNALQGFDKEVRKEKQAAIREENEQMKKVMEAQFKAEMEAAREKKQNKDNKEQRDADMHAD